jgi:hypothetical protein
LNEANESYKILKYKIEKKEFEIAKQFYTIGDYQGSLIALDPQQIYEAMQHGRYAKLAQTNLIAAYNFERLHYDALLNVNAI